jgi:hypothetical protein
LSVPKFDSFDAPVGKFDEDVDDFRVQTYFEDVFDGPNGLQPGLGLVDEGGQLPQLGEKLLGRSSIATDSEFLDADGVQPGEVAQSIKPDFFDESADDVDNKLLVSGIEHIKDAVDGIPSSS